MVKRIVSMHFLPGTEGRFLDIFENIKDVIRSQRGCMSLELLKAQETTGTNYWTISLWQSIDDLETYRASPLFQKTWTEVKTLFSARAQAWTLTSIDTL
jgi:heme-degrading monooxygenase HmoA